MTNFTRTGFAMLLSLAGLAAAQTVGYDQRYYRHVYPIRPSALRCGHVGTPPCAAATSNNSDLPANATGDELYKQFQQRSRAHDAAGAIRSLKRAAALGQVSAETAYGLNLILGKHIPRDVPAGIEWLNKAVAKNHGAAYYQLGTIYDNGEVVAQDFAKAAKYMSAGAEVNYWQAEKWMGIASELGRGVPRNRQTAIAYLNRSAGHGKDGDAQLMASFLSRTKIERFKDDEALGNAFQADFGAQYNRRYNPSGGGEGQGSRAWWDKVTGNNGQWCKSHPNPSCR